LYGKTPTSQSLYLPYFGGEVHKKTAGVGLPFLDNSNGGGGEDRTPDLGVMNPETPHFRTVDIVKVFQLHQ